MCRYPVFIGEEAVEIVNNYKYLGIIIDNKLKWDHNTDLLYQKGQQRLYFLRKLKYFRLDTELLELFYSAVVQSVITFGSVCWWSCLTNKNRVKLERVKKRAGTIIGTSLPELDKLHHEKTISKMKGIMKGTSVLSDLVCWLPSGRRLKTMKCRTSRYRNSFLPYAVRTFNIDNL